MRTHNPKNNHNLDNCIVSIMNNVDLSPDQPNVDPILVVLKGVWGDWRSDYGLF